MRSKLSLILSSIALGVLATGAWADGMPVVQSAGHSCGDGPFGGAYIGAAVGYGRHRGQSTYQVNGVGFSNDDNSATFGGYGGYNWQCGHFVLGVETDFNYLDTSPTAFDGTGTLANKIDWFGTVRARAGITIHDTFLLYATGGLAYANVDHFFSDTAAPGGPFSQSNSTTQTGWTLGGGGELTDCCGRWLVRAEAFFVDLGDKNITYTTGPCGGACVLPVRWENDFWVARIGVAYKFGEREPVVPLK